MVLLVHTMIRQPGILTRNITAGSTVAPSTQTIRTRRQCASSQPCRERQCLDAVREKKLNWQRRTVQVVQFVLQQTSCKSFSHNALLDPVLVLKGYFDTRRAFHSSNKTRNGQARFLHENCVGGYVLKDGIKELRQRDALCFVAHDHKPLGLTHCTHTSVPRKHKVDEVGACGESKLHGFRTLGRCEAAPHRALHGLHHLRRQLHAALVHQDRGRSQAEHRVAQSCNWKSPREHAEVD